METGQPRPLAEPDAGGRNPTSDPVVLWDCTPADIADPLISRLFNYWQTRRGGRRFPGRPDIDPIDFAYVLGNVVLIDVTQPGPRFRYRLIGTNLLLRDAHDRTGHWIDELPSLEYRRTVLARLNGLAERPAPVFVRNVAVLDNRQYDYEALWLPLAADGETLDMLMACQFHKVRPERL